MHEGKTKQRDQAKDDCVRQTRNAYFGSVANGQIIFSCNNQVVGKLGAPRCALDTEATTGEIAGKDSRRGTLGQEYCEG